VSQWTITIPRWTPTLLNTLLGLHWARRNKAKKADYDMVAAYARLAEVPKATGHRKVGLEVVWPKSRPGRLPDSDAFDKCLRDACVACGLIVDDSKRWATFTEPVITRGAERGTVITLENVE
jgi:hypothetical protein